MPGAGNLQAATARCGGLCTLTFTGCAKRTKLVSHPLSGESLEVNDGRSDTRFAWMQDNPVGYYCGVLISDPAGTAVGTLCHYDLQRCETRSSELPLMSAVAPLLYQAIKDLPPGR